MSLQCSMWLTYYNDISLSNIIHPNTPLTPWHRLQNSTVIWMQFLALQPFMNNHFHLLIIVELVTFWPLLQLLKSVPSLLTPHSRPPLTCWAGCCSHCRCPIIFNMLHHFLTHCIFTKPSPRTFINWQLISIGAICLIHYNQNTLHTSLLDHCHCTSAVTWTASDRLLHHVACPYYMWYLTAWSTILPKKPTRPQLVNYLHWMESEGSLRHSQVIALSWTRSTQCMPPHPTYL
jgi:hypothetical protein